jgi:hypothetical protein
MGNENGFLYRIADTHFTQLFTTVYPESKKDEPKKEDQKLVYPDYYFQMLFGRTNKNGDQTTTAIMLQMGPDSPAFKRFLETLFPNTVSHTLLKSIDQEFSDYKLKAEAYERLFNAVSDSILKAKTHVMVSFNYKDLSKGRKYTEMRSISLTDKQYYANEKYNWPTGYTPGKVALPKLLEVDLDSLIAKIPNHKNLKKAV